MKIARIKRTGMNWTIGMAIAFCLILLAGCCGRIQRVGSGPAQAADQWLPRVWQPNGQEDFTATYLKMDGCDVVLKRISGQEIRLSKDGLGTEDLRYLKNMGEITRPLREWTFLVKTWKPSAGGRRERREKDPTPKETLKFRASFVELTGFDTPLSESWVVLVKENGAKRAYPLLDFSEADQKYMRETVAAQPKVAPPSRFAHVVFKPKYDEFSPEKDKGEVNIHETKHFTFYWGNKITKEGELWSDPKFREMNYQYFETLWDFFVETRNLPLTSGTEYDKINIYVTETGLKKFEHGFAFGAEAIVVDPRAMQEGSSVTPHEFGHSMQLRLGGFHNNSMVGMFWETHADWQAHLFIPSSAGGAAGFIDSMQHGAHSVLPRYDNWPFLQYIYEHPRFYPFFNYEVWVKNIKNELDQSLEAPLQTMIRLVGEKHLLPGDPTAAFGDVIGEMAAHVGAWDYVYQYAYQRADTWRLERDRPGVNRRRTAMQPVPDKPGWYRPSQAQSPREYGFNIIDLRPDADATSITVQLRGIADVFEDSDWRATIAAVGADGEARYSRMWHQGSMTMELRPGDKSVCLAVAAAPKVYRPRTWTWIDFNQFRRFPYEVSFRKCAPAEIPSLGVVAQESGAPHPNGGGFVAQTASVAATAYVGPNARVLGKAKVLDRARIEDNAIVKDNAVVSDDAAVFGHAVVLGDARVKEKARVGGMAIVEGNGTTSGSARVLEYHSLRNDGTVDGNAVLRGSGHTTVNNRSHIGGTAMVGDLVYFNCQNQEVRYGQYHGDVLEERIKEGMDYRGLQAHWDFNDPRSEILKDAFADCDGVLRGAPAFVELGPLNSGLVLNGKDQYAVLEGVVANTGDMTLDMRLRWDGGSENQAVISFGSSKGALYFTPKDSEGKAAFGIIADGKEQKVQAKEPIPTGKWLRITVTLKGETAAMYVDGKKAGQNNAMTLHPEDVRASGGYIGRAYSDGGFFNGCLDDIGLYNTAFASVSDIPNRWWIKQRQGTWTLDEEHGVITARAEKGSKAVAVLPRNWQNYALTVRARRTQGNGPLSVFFRVNYGRYEWQIGADNNTKTAVALNGADRLGKATDLALRNGEWHDLTVKANLDRYDCYVDGRLVQSVRSMEEPLGGIGFGVADGAAEFASPRVVAADGRLLFPVAPGSEQTQAR